MKIGKKPSNKALRAWAWRICRSFSTLDYKDRFEIRATHKSGREYWIWVSGGRWGKLEVKEIEITPYRYSGYLIPKGD